MANETPSEADVRAAQEVLRKHEEAQRDAAQQQVEPVLGLVRNDSFTATLDALFGLDNSFLSDDRIGPQLMAARQGMRGLSQIAAQYPDENAEVEAEAETES